jgi:hypothetical protein
MYSFWIWFFGNLWVRAVLIASLGGLIWVDGIHSAGEAQKYKRSPESVNITTQNLNAQRQKYD